MTGYKFWIGLFTTITLMLTQAVSAQNDDADKAAISSVLDALHQHASTASWDAYFALYTDNATFLGTDAGERWDIPTFKGYAKGAKNGWTYIMHERHIDLSPDGGSAWFDELLDSEKYGTSRGTGILVKAEGGWKIAQYHLTFPIPNDLAAGITARIKAFEAAGK